ncbi:MAG: ribosome-binding factor A [Candidatus Pacebacteria bacterium]|nr:ribosome-binding factor A [Candidatus Paceibacterota bacterium]
MKKNNKNKSTRQKKVEELVRSIAAPLISKESNQTSLITITRIDISPNFKNCTVFVSVMPVLAEDSALNFLKRKRRELKNEFKKKTNLKVIPFFDFEIDFGEKNRQIIENIIQKEKII